MRRLTALATLLAASVAFAVPSFAADPGVAADKIVFGQAAAFEGPASALGLGMKEGLLAAFAEINAKGGVKGRKLDLVTRDDGYEPTKAVEAVKQLLEGDKVFALVGPVGTPTSAAAEPIAAAAGAPFIGPFTGAEFLRNPYKPHVVNVRASYFQETETMVERLTKDLKHEKIAILYQDDAFGKAGLAGVQKAMEKRGMKLVAEGTFERNTTAVKGALLAIRKGAPQSVIMIGPYKPCAEFIKLARMAKLDATFVNISFVGSNALAKELGEAGAGVVVTQVVPFPTDTVLPLVADYHKAMKAAGAGEPGFVSLEGYMVGRLVIAALGKLDGEPTRADLLKAMQSGSYDLGGVTLGYGANDNQGMDEVFLTVIQPGGGAFKPVKSLATGS